MQDDQQYRTRRRVFSILSLIAFAVIMAVASVYFAVVLSPYIGDQEKFKLFLDDLGWKGRFALFALQCLQVIVALIPGEVIEFGAGYAYGAIEGTLICLAGIAVSSSLVFLLVKKLGTPMVELFISREKMEQLKFINDESKLKCLVFLLFFIPGTPKDALTYFVGLTKLSLPQFLMITLIARIPSIITSTICGELAVDEQYWLTIVVYAITGLVSGIGYLIYKAILKKKQN